MGGFTVGLSLHPREIGLFPSDLVFPYIGIGLIGHPKRIVEYQLGINVCPHLEGNKCRIYLNRPLACQSYPFEIEDVEPLRVYLEENCRWIKESIRTQKLTRAQREGIIFSERILAPKELEASYKLYKYATKFRKSKNLWIFDLKKRMWGKGVSKAEWRRMRRT
jgi:Fe-S-cluster containining protein